MMAFIKFMNEAGFIGWTILLTGVASGFIVFERVKKLFFAYRINTDELMNRLQGLVLSRRFEDAIVLCAQMEAKPLAAAIKTILERADRDDQSLFQAQDIALSTYLPMYSKRVHYLSMLANVATLLGLLGTIHGLILSFQAVATADPATKQQLLANGISVSMYTTALGLAVAIPLMVAFSLITSKQNEMTDEMIEKTSKVTELITGSHLPAIATEHMMAVPPVVPPDAKVKSA